MAELLFKSSQGHFFAIEPIDHRKEAEKEEKAYKAEWIKFMAQEVSMPHHAYERRIAYLSPGKEMVYYTKGDYVDGRAVPSKKITRIMRDCTPISQNDIRTVLEHPRYYVKELMDRRVLDDDEYDEVYKWAVAEVARRNKAGQHIPEYSGFPLYFYGLHPLFQKFVDGKLNLMREHYAEGRYSWMMFQDPPPIATASGPEGGGRVKKKQREKFQEELEDASGLPPDYVKFAIAQQYAKQFEAIVVSENERLAKMANAKPEDCPTIPNISKKDMLYTHQALALAKLRHTNEGVIDIDVGGGKLRILVFDAILCIKEGRCKRPLIVMPNSTIVQQKAEIEHFTKHKINVIVLNSDTWLKYGIDYIKEDELGYAKFKKHVREAPPNTIVITSYEWLRTVSDKTEEAELLGEMEKAFARNPDGTLALDKDGNPVEIKAKVRMITRFPRVEWFIDDLGVDYVALDESHSIKNTGTATGNMSVHFANVPVRRIATGTITPNTPVDVWRQYGFLDSGLFRTLGDFYANYASTADRQGNVTRWKETAISEMRSKMLRHGSVSFRKAAWRHLLPKKTERFHHVEMRPNQQAVYKMLMLNIIEEIENDPRLKAEWMKFQQDPEHMKDVEVAKILAKLVRLDSILTAMGQDAGVDEIEQLDENGEVIKVETNRKFIQTLEGEDKVSPKVQALDKILDEHFSDPRNGKVVVFVQNELSAQHLYDYSVYGPKGKKLVGWFMKAPKLRDVKEAQAALDAWLDENNQEIRVLVAVDKSLRTGRNFQKVCNRVIHADMLWDPGNMEQRQGRIERPRSPFAEVGIFIDWIVTDHSAEVCKLAKLLSKQAINAQLNAGFETELDWPVVKMNPINMGAMEMPDDHTPPPPYIEWDDIAVHRTLPHLLDLHEQKMSEDFKTTYGTDLYNRYEPVKIKGSKRIFTPELKHERVKYVGYTLGAEITDKPPTEEQTQKKPGRDTDEVKRENAKGPKLKIDHKLAGGKPYLQIKDPKSIKNFDPEHLKRLGFKLKKNVLYVHRRTHLELKRIIEQLKDFGYRVDYANSPKVPHIDTIKDPRRPKAESRAKARPFSERAKPFEQERKRGPKPFEEEEEEGEDLPREEPGKAERPPKGKDEDEDETIGLDDLPEDEREPVTLELALINDEYYYRLKEPKDRLEQELAALQFKLERQHYYLPLRSWQHALISLKRIKTLGLKIDDEEQVMKSIQLRAQAAQLRPKGGFSELDIDKRAPKKKLKGSITLYYAKIDGVPNLGVTDRENIVDLSALRGLGFRPTERTYYWRRLQSKTDILLVLKRMLIAGLKIKNWEALSHTLSLLKVSTDGLEGLAPSGKKKHAGVVDQPLRFKVWGL